MVDPYFVTSDSMMQKGVTFLMVPAQNVVTDVQSCLCCSRSCFRTHLAQTSWKWSLLWIIS